MHRQSDFEASRSFLTGVSDVLFDTRPACRMDSAITYYEVDRVVAAVLGKSVVELHGQVRRPIERDRLWRL